MVHYKLYLYKILTVHVYQHCHSEIWLHGVVVISSQTGVCTISMTSIQLMNHETFGSYFFVVVFVSVRYFFRQIHYCSRTKRWGNFAISRIPLHSWLGFPCIEHVSLSLQMICDMREGENAHFRWLWFPSTLKKCTYMSLCRYSERSFVQMKSNNVNKSLFGLNMYALYYYV